MEIYSSESIIMVLIGGHPYPIPALSTAYLQLLLGTNPLHGAPTPLYGYYSNFEMNLIKCQPTYYAIMIIYVNWERKIKYSILFYSILFYSILTYKSMHGWNTSLESIHHGSRRGASSRRPGRRPHSTPQSPGPPGKKNLTHYAHIYHGNTLCYYKLINNKLLSR